MKHARTIIRIFLAVSLCLLCKPAWAGVTERIEPSIVFLTQEASPDKTSNYGSGFLVSRDNRPYLVTASHVAKDLGSDFTMIMPGDGGLPITDRMEGVKWTVSPWADVAFTGLDARDQSGLLLQRSLPARLITARTLPPSRDISLIAMGYPLALGTKGTVSPLAFETRAASGFITLDRFDTRKPATFILMQSPSISGLSGGPVFDIGRPSFDGSRMTAREGISLVGLVSGVIWDKTGGKLAMIVPATELARLFESNSPKT